MNRVLIVGGGAAGMFAAAIAAQNGCEVTIFEKNDRFGKKLYITGKGRCNVTNNCDPEELLQGVMHNSKFLYSAFYGFTSQNMMEYLENSGVKLKTERGRRVFPVSDHSSDIIRALESQMKKNGVTLKLHSEVKQVLTSEEKACGVELTDGSKFYGDSVIVATGGLSYPSTGSTGDGYRFAKDTGHKVTDLNPSLVPLLTEENYIARMQGLSLRNVELRIKQNKKLLFKDFGEMMFTHKGVTGPMILSASAVIGERLKKGALQAEIDLKPALSFEQLDARILREFEEGKNRQFKNVIGSLFPASLTPVILELGGISAEKPIHEISREERHHFEEVVKAFPFTITGLGGFNEAVITRGGISVKDIIPGTMESKKVNGLYFIGEVLDLDAVTGGYNLQIAWSTAYLAALAVSGL